MELFLTRNFLDFMQTKPEGKITDWIDTLDKEILKNYLKKLHDEGMEVGNDFIALSMFLVIMSKKDKDKLSFMVKKIAEMSLNLRLSFEKKIIYK
jgi:hypothetical protein